jgi:hypothetical protein
LYSWYTDAKLWPRDRSLKLLKEWCAMELNTVVLDLSDSPIEEEIETGAAECGRLNLWAPQAWCATIRANRLHRFYSCFSTQVHNDLSR